MAGKNPIKFTDTTFRDGHQSLLATRMRTEDIVPFMERMDQMGYFAIEVWGGATFDTTHRFLGDDPWERIRTIKGILKKTPTMMLFAARTWWGTATTPMTSPTASCATPPRPGWTSSGSSTP